MRQLALGFLDSPWGHVSIVYLKPTGLPSLMAWNADIAKASLAIFHTITRDELCSHQGYMCDVSDELGVLAAFPRPGLARAQGTNGTPLQQS
ncbi:guanylate cyclase domain-containing protein [Haematococcus lacustris]|uniref:Guanylate cyclase domain-containing protein n=1 Tax=Haematococcus lacustris TaxID=44745 RepID=A0A699Z728_HAELA|nr:guanylate cyclase domain-containing protein [Haematococcus lacustris]